METFKTFKTFKKAVIVPSYVLLLMMVMVGVFIYSKQYDQLINLVMVMSYFILFIQFIYGAKLNGIMYLTPGKIQATEDSDYFDILLEKSQENLKEYKKNLKRLVVLGDIYLSVFLINAFLLLLSTLFFASEVKLSTIGPAGPIMAAIVGVIYIIFIAFFVKIKSMEGTKLERANNPQFFKILDEAVSITKSPKINHVYLIDGDNCGISYAKVSRKFDNVIEIGIVLLELLNEEELKTIIVHELSHVNHRDVAQSNKVAIKGNKWMHINSKIEQKNGMGKNVLGGFGLVYSKLIYMHLAALLKKAELEADLKTVSYVDKKTFTKALYKLEIFASTNFYDGPIQDIGRSTKPPKNFYDILFKQFYKKYEISKDEVKKKILKKKSVKTDSHPSYRERLKAIGVEKIDFEVEFKKSESYSKEVKEMVKIANDNWCNSYGDSWNFVRDAYKKNKSIVDNYADTNDTLKNIQYAGALEELYRTDEAMVIYDKILKTDKKNSTALFRKALLLLYRNDNKGINLLVTALDLNKEFIVDGLNILDTYLSDSGLDKKREELKEWIKEKENVVYDIADEYNVLRITDKFEATSISKKDLKKIIETVKKFKSLKKAFIVKKTIENKDLAYNVIALQHGMYASVRVVRKNIEALEAYLKNNNIDASIFNLDINPLFVKPMSDVENAMVFSNKDKKK